MQALWLCCQLIVSSSIFTKLICFHESCICAHRPLLTSHMLDLGYSLEHTLCIFIINALGLIKSALLSPHNKSSRIKHCPRHCYGKFGHILKNNWAGLYFSLHLPQMKRSISLTYKTIKIILLFTYMQDFHHKYIHKSQWQT